MANFKANFLEDAGYRSLTCEDCGQWLVLKTESFEAVHDGITLDVSGLPVLTCDGCGRSYIPIRSRAALLFRVDEAKAQGKDRAVVWRKPDAGNKRFSYCLDVAFVYDATDYDYLPGLERPWDDGFLTPVFFKKTVLLKYMNVPGYAVEFGSDSYGVIYKDQENIISFGSNRSGKVILWLGDIDQLDLTEQYYLRSENVESDHDIGSEFYEGQILAVFTEPSKERQLFQVRSAFTERLLREFGLKLHQYELEVLKVMAEIVRPIAWSEKEVRGVVEALNKVVVESLNNADLRAGITTLEPKAKFDGAKGLKLLQRWLGVALDLDAPILMNPFFVLYDFRIVAAHLIEAQSAEEKLESCYERMGINGADKTLENLYDAMVKSLVNSFGTMLQAKKLPGKADAGT